ncbi:Granaticin polyketide synthase putative ketoacyl reductase 2 [Symbiodinium microadriaticum]|uniref:Granaticin polyketide synthase putative ketoacyl reductase 2 n=1 Tax=Symbiodinium microadriaticum TaxID=2951 RepID=A0A1Q9CUZ9_SYMMI|nr:Granaticin polyketide synthase putative ketoacyl reductase 2 [Symbiodinium microadriaticum]
MTWTRIAASYVRKNRELPSTAENQFHVTGKDEQAEAAVPDDAKHSPDSRRRGKSSLPVTSSASVLAQVALVVGTMWARFHRRACAALLKLQPPPHRQGLLPLLALGAGTGVLVLKRPASSPCAAEQQKVALITGSSTGIGKAVAQRLAAEGYRVVVNSHSTLEEGTALAATLPGGMYIQADCSKREGCEGLVEEVLKRCGRLDLLVCNAGLGKVIPHGNLELIDDELKTFNA